MANLPGGPTAAAAPDDEAKKQAQAKKVEDEKREAVRQLRERQQQNNAAEHYKDMHFWSYWKKLPDQPDQPDENTGALSSVPGEQTLLEPGTYEKKGIRQWPGNQPIRAHFQYDEEKKAFTVHIEVRQFTAGAGISGNHIKWVPVTKADFDKHAEITGREQVRFLAGKPNCFSKVTLTFRGPKDGKEGHPFYTGLGGNVGSNTLAYAEIQVKAALEEAMLQGVGFEVSSNFIQAVRDKRGMVEVTDEHGVKHSLSKIEIEIQKANANAEMHKLINDFTGPEALQQHQKALQATDSLSGKWDVDFKKDIDSAITAQKQKLKDLTAEITKLTDDLKDLQDKKTKATDPKDIADLSKQIADTEKQITDKTHQHDNVHIERLKELEGKKAELERDLGVVTNREQLQRIKDKLEDTKNPEQKFKDAVKELRAAIDEVAKDKKPYKDDPEKTQLNNIEKNIKELETKLGTDLTKDERNAVKAMIDDLLVGMKKLSESKPDFKQKCEAAIDKAEKYANGEKGNMDAAKRLEDRADKLEKAAAGLHKAMEEYKDFDPKKLVGPPGMIIGKKAIHLPGQSRFHRIESETQAQKFIDKRFNGLQQQREDLQKAIDAEMFKIADLSGAQKSAIQAEQKKFDEEVKKLPSPTDKSAVEAEHKKFDVAVKGIINDPVKQKNWDKMAEARKALVEVKVIQKDIEEAKKAGAAPRRPGSSIT